MKFAIASDLHLETYRDIFEEVEFQPPADVLLLAGDITTLPMARASYDRGRREAVLAEVRDHFFDNISNKFDTILWIPGNHEYYDGDFDDVNDTLCEWVDKAYPNIMFLNNETVSIKEKVSVIGSTLWTDSRIGDTGLYYPKLLNDYYAIRKEGRLITPEDTTGLFLESVEYLDIMLEESDEPCIVMSHHLPSFMSVSPKWVGSETNPFFVSDLEWLFRKHGNLTHWVHGHTHDPIEYKLEGTQVLCNPGGYSKERWGSYNFRYFEVDV